MSLRRPQVRSLEILARVAELLPLRKPTNSEAALRAISASFPGVTAFDRAFPSVCFALATGVGKTRLMGAFASYLWLAHGSRNFFVLAPNLTVYRKLIDDFTPNTAKYVFQGVAELAANPPIVTTGETYQWHAANGADAARMRVNIFNIAKINADVRGGRSSRVRGFREELGESYFDYLAGLDDLVVIMDESHRYRAAAGLRAINELAPVLGLELTATPFVESAAGLVPFSNVAFSYSLREAIDDGLVKQPAVVTREGFVPTGVSPDALEQIKLKDGLRLHESVKVDLATYARQTGARGIKPIVLVIARDTAHAAELVETIETYSNGRYLGKVIQVDSSVVDDELVERLLSVERPDNPVEVVVHVNMLKEGWDVSNLYTIVPLRAANARTLVEQSIGRGLRLPYGHRTGVAAVDRLNIVAHDHFQKIVEDARRPDSPLSIRTLVLKGEELDSETTTIASVPLVFNAEDMARSGLPGSSGLGERHSEYLDERQQLSGLAVEVILDLADRPDVLPTSGSADEPEVRNAIAEELKLRSGTAVPRETLLEIVAQASRRFADLTIDIPLIVSASRSAGPSGFVPFALDLAAFRFDVPGDALWASHLATGQVDRIETDATARSNGSLEDQIVTELIAFDDVAYEGNADLLYDLAAQVARHLRETLPPADARQVVSLHRCRIAAMIHAQLREQLWSERLPQAPVEVKRGFTALKPSFFTALAGVAHQDFRVPLPGATSISRYVFGGFSRCLYPTQKFDADAERKLAVILDRDADKWFRPARRQFAITYRSNGEEFGYQPDFVAETATGILMLECKDAKELGSAEVIAKRDAAVTWCKRATDYAVRHGGKPWTYVLIPHDTIAENMTLDSLSRRYEVRDLPAAGRAGMQQP